MEEAEEAVALEETRPAVHLAGRVLHNLGTLLGRSIALLRLRRSLLQELIATLELGHQRIKSRLLHALRCVSEFVVGA